MIQSSNVSLTGCSIAEAPLKAADFLYKTVCFRSPERWLLHLSWCV